MSENKNKIKKEEKEIQFFIERLAEVPIEQVKGQSQNDIITILFDREYLASVKENIQAIGSCSK